MKGILLAGGNGRRLGYLTEVTNKHLLAVYDKPLIFYPLETLLSCGLQDILIVSGREHVSGFLRLLGSGKQFGAKLTYKVQDDAGGIAQALSLAEEFVGDDQCAVILGDNIFEDNLAPHIQAFSDRAGSGHAGSPIRDFAGGAHIFLKEIPDAQRFGVAELDGERVIGIEEKPVSPKTNYAVTGFYLYDSTVFDVIRSLQPSGRGEYEITDVNNAYVARQSLTATVLSGDWTDAGTFESLFHANTLARKLTLARQERDHGGNVRATKNPRVSVRGLFQ